MTYYSKVGNIQLTNKYPALKMSKIPWLSAPTLPRLISRKEHDDNIELLGVLAELFRKANITFILMHGTLLGSYLSHDMLPWDDDLDVMVNFKDLPKVKNLFKDKAIWEEFSVQGFPNTGDEYDFDVLQKLPSNLDDPIYYRKNANKSSHIFKFYRNDSPKAGNYTWNWPFVDICYYTENATHVWNLPDNYQIWIKRSDFYPLHLRPFGSLWLPAPHNTRTVLLARFPKFECKTSHRLHQYEIVVKYKSAKCNSLIKYYPFVWRYKQLQGGVLELLKLDDKVIHALEVAGKYDGYGSPFAL